MKVDFSSGDCQKLPNWVKIMLQSVRKIFTAGPKKSHLFYNINSFFLLFSFDYKVFI